METWLLLGAVVALSGGALLARTVYRLICNKRFARACKEFHLRREHLEVKFIRLASANPKPNSPHWEACDFGDDVFYVRNRVDGRLSAFVSVVVPVEAFARSSERRENVVSHLRAGTAVFHRDRDHWETDGLAILNLTPDEAIRFYRNDYEMLGRELAERIT